ncbi:MAG: hypothetical protein HY548_08085, partial [Elusimicrobia bacterium]|nr:hypothetical protein [Elusimicrobiota bacterium]
MTWDTTKPAGTRAVSLGDDDIREFKTDMQTALRGNAAEGTEAMFPGSDSVNPVFRYRGLSGTTAARPAAGQYGLYRNTTLNTLQRDNGTTWDDIATLIPSGTKMVFYQASAPTGWTAVAVNDKFLRVVTAGGSGGSTGGTVAASTSLAHSHTVSGHTHDLGNHTHPGPSHTHSIDSGGAHTHTLVEADGGSTSARFIYATGDGTNKATTDSQGAHDHGGATGAEGTGNTSTPSTNT